MILLTQLAGSIVDLLRADEALSSWCSSVCGRPLTVLEGTSPADPPRESEAPFVVVDALSSTRGRLSDIPFVLCVDLGLLRRPGQSVLACKTELEQGLGAHVERVLSQVSGNISFEELADEFDADGDPLVILEKTITVSVPNLIGADVDL